MAMNNYQQKNTRIKFWIKPQLVVGFDCYGKPNKANVNYKPVWEEKLITAVNKDQ